VRHAGLLVALLACTGTAHAEPGDASLGLGIGIPGEGSGLPLGGHHVPIGVVARYELAGWRPVLPAVAAGIGVPMAGVGASLWLGLELRHPLLTRLMLYATPGLRTGFVGPGYYARHSDVFVGFDYIYSGPWTLAPRLPVGVAVPMGRAELWFEALVEAPLLPGPELLVGGAFGVRVRL
jgi:hypothetical protein